MGNWFNEVIALSVQASILAIIVIALRAIFKERIPKVAIHIMWILVFLKFIVPINLSSPVEVFNRSGSINLSNNSLVEESIIDSSNTETVRETSSNTSDITSGTVPNERETSTDSTSGIVSSERETSSNSTTSNGEITTIGNEDTRVAINSRNLLSVIWIAGVTLAVGALIAMSIITSKRFKYRELVQSDYIDSIKREYNIKAKVYKDKNAASPMVLGVINPKIILPIDFNIEDNETLKYILVHENEHIRWMDNLTNIVALMVLGVQWFNPVAWASYYLLNKDIETFCDERVLKSVGVESKQNYAKALLDCAINTTRLVPTYTCSFGENNVKGRIKGVMKYKKTTLFTAIIAGVLVIGAVFLFATNGTSNNSLNRLEFTELEQLFIHIQPDEDYDTTIEKIEESGLEYYTVDSPDFRNHIDIEVLIEGEDGLNKQLMYDSISISFDWDNNIENMSISKTQSKYRYEISEYPKPDKTAVYIALADETGDSLYKENTRILVDSKEDAIEYVYNHMAMVEQGIEEPIARRFSKEELEQALDRANDHERLLMSLEYGEDRESVISKVEESGLEYEFLSDIYMNGLTIELLDEHQLNNDMYLTIEMSIRTEIVEGKEQLDYVNYLVDVKDMESDESIAHAIVLVSEQDNRAVIEQAVEGGFERSIIKLESVEECVRYINAFLNSLD